MEEARDCQSSHKVARPLTHCVLAAGTAPSYSPCLGVGQSVWSKTGLAEEDGSGIVEARGCQSSHKVARPLTHCVLAAGTARTALALDSQCGQRAALQRKTGLVWLKRGVFSHHIKLHGH